MANATTHRDTANPTLHSVRALLALAFQYLGNPARTRDLQRIFEQTEALFARIIFETAARIAGRPDLLETHEAYVDTRRGVLNIMVREKPRARPPLQQVMRRRRFLTALNRYRTAHGCRTRLSAKPSRIRAANQQRRQAVTSTSRRACAAPPSHTPAHINAPP